METVNGNLNFFPFSCQWLLCLILFLDMFFCNSISTMQRGPLHSPRLSLFVRANESIMSKWCAQGPTPWRLVTSLWVSISQESLIDLQMFHGIRNEKSMIVLWKHVNGTLLINNLHISITWITRGVLIRDSSVEYNRNHRWHLSTIN